MNLLILSLATALPGERTEKQQGGETINNKIHSACLSIITLSTNYYIFILLSNNAM